MKAEEIIGFVKVSEQVVFHKKKELFDMLRRACEDAKELCPLDEFQAKAIYDYVNYFTDKNSILLYDKFKWMAEKDCVKQELWLYANNRSVVPTTILPTEYFRCVVKLLNA